MNESLHDMLKRHKQELWTLKTVDNPFWNSSIEDILRNARSDYYLIKKTDPLISNLRLIDLSTSSKSRELFSRLEELLPSW